MVGVKKGWSWDDGYEVVDSSVVEEVEDAWAGTGVLPDLETEFGGE